MAFFNKFFCYKDERSEGKRVRNKIIRGKAEYEWSTPSKVEIGHSSVDGASIFHLAHSLIDIYVIDELGEYVISFSVHLHDT